MTTDSSMFGLRALAEFASDLTSRAGIAMRAGLSFKGKRDMYEALGFARVLRSADYRARYERGGIAARVVDSYPKATWREGAELVESENPRIVTKFEEEWDKLAERLQLWTVFQRADILAGLGRFAVVLLGVPGKFDEEIPALTSQTDLRYVAVFSEEEVSVERVEENAEDPRFGQPLYYTLQRTSKHLTGGAIERRIHWSRLIHIADNVLDDIIYGAPRMERVWNDLDNLDKVVGGGSEAFWLRVNQGLFFNIDPAAKIDDDAIKAMKKQSEEFAHGMQRTLAMRGASMESLGSDVSNFQSQVASIISLISGATGIPQRILLGSERGELASSQDQENWDTRVSDRRTSFAEPHIVRPFVDRLTRYGVLPKVSRYDVRWPDYDDLTEIERSTVADVWSRLNAQAGGTVVTPDEIRDRILKLDPLDPTLVQTPAPPVPSPEPAPPAGPASVPTAPDAPPPPAPTAAPAARSRGERSVARSSGPKATGVPSTVSRTSTHRASRGW